MFDFFDKIIGMAEMLLYFFYNILDGLLKAVLFLSNGSTFVIQLSGLMPSIITSSVLIVLFVSVLKFILGR